MSILSDIALIALFILIGGTFAAAEIALVTLRESQIQQLSTKGKRGLAIAKLTSNPNRFLSAVQIGVTLSGFLSAAFGGATLATSVSPWLQRLGVPDPPADTLALVLVTVIISYFSIVVGELTAKRLAMQRAESMSLALAPLISGIATIARPVIWFLGASTDVLVRLLGGDPTQSRDEVSDEELRAMVNSSAALGSEQRDIVDDVFEAGERNLREVMTPRVEVDFLPAEMPIQLAYREVRGGAHSRYPVTDDSVDQILGFVHVRDLMALEDEARQGSIREIARPILFLPETARVLLSLSSMRNAGAHMAVVKDEYGGTAGIVTLEDLVEELVGEITDEYDLVGLASQRVDRLDGRTTLAEFREATGFTLPDGPYDTVAGWFMAELGKVPTLNETVTVALPSPESDAEEEIVHLVFTVEEMDKRRVARFSVNREGATHER